MAAFIVKLGTRWRGSDQTHAPSALPCGEDIPVPIRTGGCVGRRADLDVLWKRLLLARFEYQVIHPVAQSLC